ncbi:hypothetical protein BC943DRAFT_105201 [Umbelopsis sp. AD052]|nr:hypothetical protein BC943DRAFT_105201 [Umbelopsis sp. AD052]
MEAQDANSKNERDDHLDRSEEIPTSDDLSELSTSSSEVEETQATSGTVSDSEENINITSKHNDEISNSFGFEQKVTPSEDAVDNAAATVFQNDEEEQNFNNSATQEAVEAETTLYPNSGSIPEEPESSGNADEFDTFENQETDFNFNEEGQNDDFGDFGDFDGPGDLSNADDDFGDFGDFDEVSEVKNPVEIQPEAIRLDGIDNYLQSLQDGDMNNVIGFLDTFFDKSLDDSTSENNSNALESISDVSNSSDPIQSPSERNLNERSRALLSTETSIYGTSSLRTQYSIIQSLEQLGNFSGQDQKSIRCT